MSGGYGYGYEEPTENCPYCGTPCRADFVDVGVGFTQCGPYHCEACQASEIGPYDVWTRDRTAEEIRTGWYEPGAEPGSSANVIGGRVVNHVQMKTAYREKFGGSPFHNQPEYVENWFKDIRKK